MAESKPSTLDAAPVPADISMFKENGQVVFRTDGAMAFYVYDKDEPGRSTCEGICAQAFKPVIASEGSTPLGDWTLITRKDGAKQWAYKRKPIYTFAIDVPGKPQADGRDGVWHVLKP